MIDVRLTPRFADWLARLKDETAQARISERLRRAARGNLGDVKTVGGGVLEMRVAYGPGYRLYFVRRGEALIVLLCGGDKGSQRRDIETAKAMSEEV